MIMLLLRLIPFVGPLGILFGFGRRVLQLKQSKIAHAAVGEQFPVSNQVEIDNHSVRIQIAAWRLAAGVGLVTSGICFGQWRINDAWKDSYKQTAALEKGKTLMAQNDANQRFVDYVNLKDKFDNLVALEGEASKKREGLIAVSVKQRTEIRKRRADSEEKLPTTDIDPIEWMRVQAASDGATSTSPAAVPDAAAVQAGPG